MGNTYTWIISSLDCKPQVGDLKDYVVTSHWRCSGTDEEGRSGQCYSTAPFTIDPEKPNYTPFEDLTEEEVIEWTQAALGEARVASIYESIDAQIENQKNPPVVTPPLPWSA